MQNRVLVWDIETAGVSALKADLGFVVCVGYKWFGEKKVHCLIARKKDLRTFSDRWILRKASKLCKRLQSWQRLKREEKWLSICSKVLRLLLLWLEKGG